MTRFSITFLLVFFVCSTVLGNPVTVSQTDEVPHTIIQQYRLDILAGEVDSAEDTSCQCDETCECVDSDELDQCDCEENPDECQGECH